MLVNTNILFLDRDGVINRKAPPHEYITSIAEFVFLPGTIETLQKLQTAGYLFYIVTNQAGIGRGKMTMADVDSIHAHMKNELRKAGVEIAGIYMCPHTEADACDCRKPKPGMFLKASIEDDIDLSKALFVGDSENDAAAGEAAGVRTILVQSDTGIFAALPELL